MKNTTLTMNTLATIKKHGAIKCAQAAQLNLIEGEGGSMIASELGVHHASTSAMIRAGEVLLNRGFSTC